MIHLDDKKNFQLSKNTSPRNKKELLGFAKYLTRFIANYAEPTYPLTSMLSIKGEFVWDHPQQSKFHEWKKMLPSDPVFKIFDPNKKSVLTTDAPLHNLEGTLDKQKY